MRCFVVIPSILAIFVMASCKPLSPGPITKDIQVDLPGSERINKRSPTDYIEDSATILSEIPTDDDSQEDDDYSANDDPTDDNPTDELEALESKEDFSVAESNIVFQPLFVSRRRSVIKNRVSRSLDDVKDHKRVFVPLFRSESHTSEKLRLRRSVENVSQTKTKDVIETEDKLEDYDTVYKPSTKGKPRRLRSIPEVDLLRNDDQLVDDMAFAENGLIFRPVFRTRQRDSGSV